MNINQIYTVTVDKLINGGNAFVKIDNFPVFIIGGVPGDILKIKIINITKSYAKAQIVEILTPSEYRVKPLCSLHNICGGCGLQHIAYDEQLRQKKNIVRETLYNIAGLDFDIQDVIQSPQTKEYRYKIQYPVQEKKSGRIIGGYYKKYSHELVNIKYCPMHEPVVSEIFEFIKTKAQELKISAYDEVSHKGLLRHVIFRQSYFSKDILIIFVINSNKIDEKLNKLSHEISSNYSSVKGICVSFNTKRTNVILGNNILPVIGNTYYNETLNKIKFRISAESFFQVNPASALNMFNCVKEIISARIKMPSVLDAYSGVSSFGIWLSDTASEVVSIEECKSASLDAIENIKLNNMKNIEILNGDAGINFDKLKKSGKTFDVVLIDPPRSGLSNQAIENTSALTNKYIVYVSCNPATLARDLKYLINKNFKPEIIQPIDMFPNTPHIETVVLLKKT